MGKFPPGVESVVPTVKVAVPDPVSEDTLRLAATPAGCPRTITLRLTTPAKPLSEVSEMVLVAVRPWVILRVAGEAASAKFGPVGAGPSVLSRACPLGKPQPVTKS